MKDDEVLLPAEVAPMLRVEVATLATWRHRGGDGPEWFTIGKKKPAYMRSDVDAYILRKRAEAREKQAREHRSVSS